jgi:hypothetical protein
MANQRGRADLAPWEQRIELEARRAKREREKIGKKQTRYGGI